MVDYLKNGVAINAVNMPALTPDQYKALGPYIKLTERLGALAAQIASGNPKGVRLIYSGAIGDGNTNLIRNAGLVGLLNRWLSQRATLVNALQLAQQRGLAISEMHDAKTSHFNTVTLELETDSGITEVKGAVVLGRSRLLRLDGISCEVPLSGHVLFMKNRDVPGVIGHVGTVLGKNGVNIANFSLGRPEERKSEGEPATALAVVETDRPVPEDVIAQLKKNPAVRIARPVEL